MVDLDLSGIDEFLSALTLEQNRFNNDISAKFREWVRIIFYDIIDLTPQWSGNLAANWNISVSGTSMPEQTIPEKALMWPLQLWLEPFQRGDPGAVAVSEARFHDTMFGYSDNVYIYNPTDIAQAVEDQSIHIRAVNLLDGRVAMVAHAEAFYSNYMPPL